MPDDNALINPTRLLFELQNIARLNQSLSGCLAPEAIAATITDGLVNEFNCSFVRIWLIESDRTALRLVASVVGCILAWMGISPQYQWVLIR